MEETQAVAAGVRHFADLTEAEIDAVSGAQIVVLPDIAPMISIGVGVGGNGGAGGNATNTFTNSAAPGGSDIGVPVPGPIEE